MEYSLWPLVLGKSIKYSELITRGHHYWEMMRNWWDFVSLIRLGNRKFAREFTQFLHRFLYEYIDAWRQEIANKKYLCYINVQLFDLNFFAFEFSWLEIPRTSFQFVLWKMMAWGRVKTCTTILSAQIALADSCNQ